MLGRFFTIFHHTLRKHAYLNILQFSPLKTESFQVTRPVARQDSSPELALINEIKNYDNILILVCVCGVCVCVCACVRACVHACVCWGVRRCWREEGRHGFVCVEVLWPSQPSGVMSSAVSLPNHTFTGQA